MTLLRGITWSHSRGYIPLIASSEAWHDLHPEMTIEWHRRSLWGFGEGPLEEVARDYALIVFDHPFTGRAVAQGLFLPVDKYLPSHHIAELANSAVGKSWESYSIGEHQYGLPVDAACQMAACRPDLFNAIGESIPRTWEEVIALAKRTGRVRCAFSPMSAMAMFHALCAAKGESPGHLGNTSYVERSAAEQSLNQLQELFLAVGPEMLEQSPVAILGTMACTQEVLYAPLLFGYSNYSRKGYAPHTVKFIPPPICEAGSGATLGGAGMAVSTFSRSRNIALEFAAWVAGRECQTSVYVFAGGQPANQYAWNNPLANRISEGFFQSMLPVINQAYLRPTYDGFTNFQSAAAKLIHHFLQENLSLEATLDAIDQLHSNSTATVWK